jgi:hypothetical protein
MIRFFVDPFMPRIPRFESDREGTPMIEQQSAECSTEQVRIVAMLADAMGQLARQDKTKARLVEMRFLDGMTEQDIAESIFMPVHTVRRELRVAQEWIQQEIEA